MLVFQSKKWAASSALGRTLHDQWAFLGAEHHASLLPASDRRFVEGYLRGNRPAHERGPDLNRITWERKKRNWRKPITIVCLAVGWPWSACKLFDE